MKIPRWTIFLVATWLPLVSSAQRRLERPESVSLVQLISTPEKYEGKYIQTIGFVVIEFEGDSIYLHRDDSSESIFKNGIWLDAQQCKDSNGKVFKNGYGVVTGTFTAQSKGHRDMWSGSIDVEQCRSWPPRIDKGRS